MLCCKVVFFMCLWLCGWFTAKVWRNEGSGSHSSVKLPEDELITFDGVFYNISLVFVVADYFFSSF